MSFCCERCGVQPEPSYGNDSAQDSPQAIRLTEVQTHFGVLAIMCIDCRKMWQKFLNQNKNMRLYSETVFRIEHWRVSHRKTGAADINEGLGYLRTLEATTWIRAGATKSEMEARTTK